jgi:hypothetical protein
LRLSARRDLCCGLRVADRHGTAFAFPGLDDLTRHRLAPAVHIRGRMAYAGRESRECEGEKPFVR